MDGSQRDQLEALKLTMQNMATTKTKADVDAVWKAKPKGDWNHGYNLERYEAVASVGARIDLALRFLVDQSRASGHRGLKASQAAKLVRMLREGMELAEQELLKCETSDKTSWAAGKLLFDEDMLRFSGRDVGEDIDLRRRMKLVRDYQAAAKDFPGGAKTKNVTFDKSLADPKAGPGAKSLAKLAKKDCYTCGRTGHVAWQCPEKGTTSILKKKRGGK